MRNIIGEKFGQLTVIKRQGSNKYKRAMWLCLCNCGNTKVTTGFNLVNNMTKTCGHKGITKLHQYTYNSWSSMINRCNNTNHKSYNKYGNSGISVCDRWLNFENFLEDMGERPQGTSIDRIAGASIYSKETCKWSDRSEQGFNTKYNNKLGVTGVRLHKSGKYEARITKNKKAIYLGLFDTIKEAKEARKKPKINITLM